MLSELIIVGAGVRAACQSARRAGLEVYAADLFADADTRQAARAAVRVRPYPAGLIEAVRQFPPAPWMYTGALENHPRLIDRLAKQRRLYGNPPSVLRAVRNPRRLAAALRAAGLPAATAWLDAAKASPAENWLLKPRAGAGGMGIAPWNGTPGTLPRGWYLQRWVAGGSLSAVFVAAGGAAHLLGTSRQLIGLPEFGAEGFRYVGNVAPGTDQPDLLAGIAECGQALSAAFGLVGLFGVDGVPAEEGFVPVEVNPRYTASVELHELLRQDSLVARHLAACRGEMPAAMPANPPGHMGKAILFARSDLTVHREFSQRLAEGNRGDCRWADLPAEGEAIQAGHPIATVLARGRDEQEVLARLRRAARQAYADLEPAGSR